MSHRCMANQYVVWDKYTLAITACFQPELPPQEWTYFWKKNLWRTLQHRRMDKIWTPRNTPSQHTTKPAGTTSSSHCANAEFGKVPASSFDGHSPGQRANKQHLFVGGQAMGMGEKKACTRGNRFIIHIRFERFFSFKEWFGSYRCSNKASLNAVIFSDTSDKQDWKSRQSQADSYCKKRAKKHVEWSSCQVRSPNCAATSDCMTLRNLERRGA